MVQVIFPQNSICEADSLSWMSEDMLLDMVREMPPLEEEAASTITTFDIETRPADFESLYPKTSAYFMASPSRPGKVHSSEILMMLLVLQMEKYAMMQTSHLLMREISRRERYRCMRDVVTLWPDSLMDAITKVTNDVRRKEKVQREYRHEQKIILKAKTRKVPECRSPATASWTNGNGFRKQMMVGNVAVRANHR